MLPSSKNSLLTTSGTIYWTSETRKNHTICFVQSVAPDPSAMHRSAELKASFVGAQIVQRAVLKFSIACTNPLSENAFNCALACKSYVALQCSLRGYLGLRGILRLICLGYKLVIWFSVLLRGQWQEGDNLCPVTHIEPIRPFGKVQYELPLL